MLKCKIDRETGRIHVKTKGRLDDITAESMAVLKEIYSGIARQNPEAAKEFKNTVIGVVLDPASPVWKEET